MYFYFKSVVKGLVLRGGIEGRQGVKGDRGEPGMTEEQVDALVNSVVTEMFNNKKMDGD